MKPLAHRSEIWEGFSFWICLVGMAAGIISLVTVMFGLGMLAFAVLRHWAAWLGVS